MWGYQSHGVANHNQDQQGDRKGNPDGQRLDGTVGIGLVFHHGKKSGAQTN